MKFFYRYLIHKQSTILQVITQDCQGRILKLFGISCVYIILGLLHQSQNMAYIVFKCFESKFNVKL